MNQYLVNILILLTTEADKTTKTWFLSTWSSTWQKANEDCKIHGMKLTTFGSEKEEGDDLLKFYNLLSSHPDAFIGYTDEGHEGTFTSLTGEKLEIGFTFHHGEPNNDGGVEDCLAVKNLNKTLKCNDIGCSINKPFICEQENFVKIGSYKSKH